MASNAGVGSYVARQRGAFVPTKTGRTSGKTGLHPEDLVSETQVWHAPDMYNSLPKDLCQNKSYSAEEIAQRAADEQSRKPRGVRTIRPHAAQNSNAAQKAVAEFHATFRF